MSIKYVNMELHCMCRPQESPSHPFHVIQRRKRFIARVTHTYKRNDKTMGKKASKVDGRHICCSWGHTQRRSQRVFKCCRLGCWHPCTFHPRSVVVGLTGCVARPENAAAPCYIVDRWESIQRGISRIADASVVAGDTLGVGVSEYSNVVASGVGIHGPSILVA